MMCTILHLWLPFISTGARISVSDEGTYTLSLKPCLLGEASGSNLPITPLKSHPPQPFPPTLSWP